MRFEKALEIVKARYGLLFSYVDARTGKMMVVIKAEEELKQIPGVTDPTGGISLFFSDVIELAQDRTTIRELVGRKNPAAELGRKGGQEISKRGPEYFRELQARRKTRAGGRPQKSENHG
jgi:hypothetical protein